MSKIASGIASFRSKVSELYWAAVKTVGPLVPTPQVIGAALAGVVIQYLQVRGIDLSPWGITPGFISVTSATIVAYLIGPERDLEGNRLNQVEIGEVTFPEPPELRVVGSSDTPPEAPGQFVGPEDGNDRPGSGLV